MGLSVAGAKHGDAILIDEVVRREEAAEVLSSCIGRVPATLLPTAAAPDSAHKDEPDPESARFGGLSRQNVRLIHEGI